MRITNNRNEIMRLDELFKRYLDPPQRVRISRRTVTITTGIPCAPYSFALERIDTPLKLVSWLRHFGEKVWFDAQLSVELIDRVSAHFGWDVHRS